MGNSKMGNGEVDRRHAEAEGNARNSSEQLAGGNVL